MDTNYFDTLIDEVAEELKEQSLITGSYRLPEDDERGEEHGRNSKTDKETGSPVGECTSEQGNNEQSVQRSDVPTRVESGVGTEHTKKDAEGRTDTNFTTREDEFSKKDPYKVDAEEKQQDEDITWSPIGVMPQKERSIPKRVNLTNARRKDNRTNVASGLFGAHKIEFASQSFTAKQAFDSQKLSKPRWAVTGCVLLRDGGICQACGDRVGSKFEVVQIFPVKSGFGFAENNCITVCSECAICWKQAYGVSVSDVGDNQYGKIKHRLSILTRRLNDYHGCCSLSAQGLVVRRSLLAQMELMELSLEDEREKTEKELKRRLENE